MVIVINGAIGTGKTAVAWELLSLFERAVMLDGDYYAALQPFSIHEPADRTYVYESMAHQIKFHCAHGFEHFIINYVLERPEEVCKLAGLLPKQAGALHKFVLSCERSERERRIRHRNNGDLDWELNRSAELARILHESNRQRSLGREINTTNASIAEVAAIVFAWINDTN